MGSNSNFTRKHYEIVAEILDRKKEDCVKFAIDFDKSADYVEGIIDAFASLREEFSNMFKEDNPRFDPVKFDLACLKTTMDQLKKIVPPKSN